MLTREDWLWEMAAYYDYFARTYGWDKEQTDSQPQWLIDRLPGIGQIRAEIEKEQIDRA